MKRREFLKAAVAFATAAVVGPTLPALGGPVGYPVVMLAGRAVGKSTLAPLRQFVRLPNQDVWRYEYILRRGIYTLPGAFPVGFARD